MATSGTTTFQPPIADLITEAFERIQIYPPQLETEHMIAARRTANLILQDWSGNRNVNLWAVDLLTLTLVPGQATYTLPGDTIQLLDVYTRQYQFNTTSSISLGNALTPMVTVGGVPLVTVNGDPLVLAPGSNTLTANAGSTLVTMNWPNHGLVPGKAFNFTVPGSIGGIPLPYFYTVEQVIDSNHFTFNATQPATFSSANQGATPLFATTAGSTSVSVILPNHGLGVGATFLVNVPVTIGGITIPAGSYTVTTVVNFYNFTITIAAPAVTSTAVFENNGQLLISLQQANVDPLDIILYGLSRTEYASIPDKFLMSRPTTFWFNRQIIPTITVWEVPPFPSQTGGISYSLQMYRMREIQDANPIMGQTPDMASRFYPAFAAELTAGLAEKFAPAQFAQKLQLAVTAWKRAADADAENVPWFITPGLYGYFH